MKLSQFRFRLPDEQIALYPPHRAFENEDGTVERIYQRDRCRLMVVHRKSQAIDLWKKEGHCKEFLNFDLLETYKDFGGIRIEDDLLITEDGCRFMGSKRIPYHPQELEDFMKNN